MPDHAVRWLETTTAELLAGCRVPAADGTMLYTPDGMGNYPALWTRDFTYMAQYAGYLLPTAHLLAGFEYLLAGQREDGAMPDRVQPNGHAVYVAGPEANPIGLANLDNPAFMVLLADVCLNALPKAEAMAKAAAWREPLLRGLDWVPRSEAGLVYNDPAQPHSPYGFTDTIAKTGELLFESLLDWEACRRWLAREPELTVLATRRARIEAALPRLWDETVGLHLAASVDGRLPDIWGNAFALHLGVPLGERREQAARWFATHLGDYAWRGQIRHLPVGLYWPRFLLDVPPDRYQNGAYWATATGWVLDALYLSEPALARQMFDELVADFRARGVFECVHGEYTKLARYVASATNPLGVARRLWGAGG